MIDTIEEVVSKGITEAELVRAKQQFRKYIDQLSADTPKLLIELAESTAAGDWRLFFLNRDRLEKVTVDEVNAVAKKYLQQSNRTVGVYIPTQQPQRTPIAAPPDVAALVKDYTGRSESSAGEVFDVSPAAIEARVKRSAIEGVKLALLPKKNRGGTVVLQLKLRYGSAKSLFGSSEACDFLPSLMARGTKDLTSEQLADKLDELQSTLVASGGAGEARGAGGAGAGPVGAAGSTPEVGGAGGAGTSGGTAPGVASRGEPENDEPGSETEGPLSPLLPGTDSFGST